MSVNSTAMTCVSLGTAPSGMDTQTTSNGQLHPCSHMVFVKLCRLDIKVYGSCGQAACGEGKMNFRHKICRRGNNLLLIIWGFGWGKTTRWCLISSLCIHKKTEPVYLIVFWWMDGLYSWEQPLVTHCSFYSIAILVLDTPVCTKVVDSYTE